MGIMITYGSYVDKDFNLSKAIAQIEFFDTGVAFLAGMMIIPAVFVFSGTEGMASGPSLMFISLPKVFAAMGGAGRIVGIVFFLMVAVAAIICLGYNVFYFELQLPNGQTGQILDVMDYISNSFLMPLISLFTCILVGWIVKPQWIIDEVESSGHPFRRKHLYVFMIRYVTPIIMAVLFIQSVIGI